jgi:hypothetical protein
MTIRSGLICATLGTLDLDTARSAEELINRDNTMMGISSERIELLGSGNWQSRIRLIRRSVCGTL